jgi:cell division protein FtsL
MTPPAAVAAPAVHPRRTREAPAAPPPKRAPGRPRPLSVPHAPRRVSGPARRRISDRPASRRGEGKRGIALGLIATLEGLSRHRLLDRLIRGRTWIALVAFALIGIVTLQLGLLKMNGSIGRALAHEALLQRENAALSIENSELAAGARVQSQAAQIGMQFVPAGALRFLAARPGTDATRGAAAVSTPTHSPTPAGEQAPGAGSTAPGSSTEAQAASEPSGTPSAATPSSVESPHPSSAESAGTSSAQASTGSAESTTASATTAPSATAPAGSGSAEAAPGGGTQSGPPGG